MLYYVITTVFNDIYYTLNIDFVPEGYYVYYKKSTDAAYTYAGRTNISGESGYQISQSTSKTATKVVSTYSTKSGTSNKTYYYKVRAYKTVGSTKIYGPWSSVTSYKLK